jgi:hypothetical protein
LALEVLHRTIMGFGFLASAERPKVAIVRAASQPPLSVTKQWIFIVLWTKITSATSQFRAVHAANLGATDIVNLL